MSQLRELVPPSWKDLLSDALAAPSFAELETFLEGEFSTAKVFPPREQIFAALAHTPPGNVKVVLLGQDPYPKEGDANGLAFSVSPGRKIPGSLRNVFLGLKAELGLEVPKTGDLTVWADRGVLLLNTVLTVREHEANAHKKKGWEPFTEAVLKHVNEQPGPIVFLCFGKPAEKMVEKLVDKTKHHVVVTPHPSPLNKNAFVDAVKAEKIFTKVNDLLRAGGREPIDWSLPFDGAQG